MPENHQIEAFSLVGILGIGLLTFLIGGLNTGLFVHDTPEQMELFVNNFKITGDVQIPLPVKEDRIKMFAGKFGPYEENPISYLQVNLCAVPYGYEVLICEEVTNFQYRNNYVFFVNGYEPDEYIGKTAYKDATVYYIVINKQTGITRHSPIARVEIE